MRTEIAKGTIVLYADENFILTDGESAGREVWLGKWDAAENWREVPVTEEDKGETVNGVSVDESE